jgi:diguanylate cyclase (GGDEF)-like protein/PAS domain S-box-containing protein
MGRLLPHSLLIGWIHARRGLFNGLAQISVFLSTRTLKTFFSEDTRQVVMNGNPREICRPDVTDLLSADDALPQPGHSCVKQAPTPAIAVTNRQPDAQVMLNLINSTSDLIWSLDLDYRFLVFNRAISELIENFHGVRPALGDNALEILPTQEAEEWLNYYQRTLVLGSLNFELPTHHERCLEVSLERIDFNGVPTGFAGIARDITRRKLAEQAHQDAEERYLHLFDGALEGMYRTNLDGSVMSANPALIRMLGYDSEDSYKALIKHVGSDVWAHPEEREELLRTIGICHVVRGYECQFKRRDGSLLWISLDARFACDAEGQPLYLEGFCEDISARKEAEKLLQQSEARYRTAFQTTLDAVAINRVDDGSYIECNKAFIDISGYSHQEIIGHTSLELNIWVDGRDRLKMVQLVRQDANCRNLEAQFRRKNGEIFWGLMSATAMETDGVPCVLSITRDISDAKIAEEEIRTLAFYDTLTGLPNRRLLLERLQQSLVMSKRSMRKRALLVVDLDNFKTVNDTQGHQTGDLMLSEVARRLSRCARETDTIARLGGDEFVVMLEELSETASDAAAQAQNVAEKILTAIAEPYELSGHTCLGACSIGITVFGDPREDSSEVLQQADIAMYQAKAAGRNTMHFFAPALQAAVNARAALEDDLRQAIRNQQFLLWYQPQISRGRLVGAEALLRWQHPRRGTLAPGEFIHLAEETGLILPLGNWVLETACMQIAAWSTNKETESLIIAVNISARQFRQPDFVDQVLGSLERTGAEPHNLKLELTESMLVENIEDVIANMTALKAHGIQFSLDDFGTGYSSLAYLHRLPLDQLKIDQSFVRGLLEDGTYGAIAQAVISLGFAMGLSVIAEGVETEAQRAFLTHLGCHHFQGYLFSRPLPLEDFQMRMATFTLPPLTAESTI